MTIAFIQNTSTYKSFTKKKNHVKNSYVTVFTVFKEMRKIFFLSIMKNYFQVPTKIENYMLFEVMDGKIR